MSNLIEKELPEIVYSTMGFGWCQLETRHLVLRNIASGPEIGLPGPDFGRIIVGKAGPEARFPAQKHCCGTWGIWRCFFGGCQAPCAQHHVWGTPEDQLSGHIRDPASPGSWLRRGHRHPCTTVIHATQRSNNLYLKSRGPPPSPRPLPRGWPGRICPASAGEIWPGRCRGRGRGRGEGPDS